MRFCLLETSCEQEDNFPPNIAVKINDKMCPLPVSFPASFTLKTLTKALLLNGLDPLTHVFT